jgi:hypothetical protein
MEENISDIKNDDSKINEVNNKDSNQNEILIEQKEKKNDNNIENILDNNEKRKQCDLLSIIFELLFIISFLSLIFYKGIFNVFQVLPYLILLIIINIQSYYENVNQLYLYNYLLTLRLFPIGNLIGYIFVILNESKKEAIDIIFIIILSFGTIVGFFSLFRFYMKFKNKFNNITTKNIFYIYFEILALLCIHAILLKSFYDFTLERLPSISSGIMCVFKIFSCFGLELFLFIINYLLFMNYDPEKKFSCGCKCSICSEIIKITLYIIVELILFSEQHTIIYNIFLIIRVFLMALSLLSLFILIIYGLC